MKKMIFQSLAGLVLVLILSSCSGGAGPGGGDSPLGPVGGSGNYGAPPISMPGPVALNMSSISVTLEGSDALVNGGPGTGQAGNEARVRNLGPVTAWYNPFQKIFISRAYAGAGGSFTATIGPDGSFKGIVPGSAVGDVLELVQCYPGLKSNCSVPIYYKIGTGPVPAGSIKSSYKGMGIGKDGSVYTGSQNKKWHWWNLFVSEAYAAEGAGSTGGILSPSSGPTLVTEDPVDPMRGYTPATCSIADFPGLSMVPLRTDKQCHIKKTSAASNNTTDIAVIDGCDPEKMGLYLFDDGSGERLAVFSQNKLWLFRTGTGAFEKKYSYWGEISKVNYFNGFLAVAIDSPAGAPVPAIATDQACWDAPFLRTVREVLSIDNGGEGHSFLFSVKDSSNKYFVVVGPATEFVMDEFHKVEPSVSDTKLTDVFFLPGTNCGYQFAALSPDDRKIAYGYYKHPIAGLEATCPESWMRKVSIPGSTSPVSMAYDKNNTLVVLDATDQASKLISFALDFGGETFSVTYSTTVDLGGVRANFVRFAASQGEFVTDAPSSAEGRTLTRVSRSRVQRAAPTGILELNPDLITVPFTPPAPVPVIR